jgi:hypothetical protein
MEYVCLKVVSEGYGVNEMNKLKAEYIIEEELNLILIADSDWNKI